MRERTDPVTKVPERECEECRKWLGLYEFPTTHRTWVCKVCQGLKAPPKQKATSNVNYQDYLTALESVDEERDALKRRYQDEDRHLIKRRKEIVKAYYARLGKGIPLGRPSKEVENP